MEHFLIRVAIDALPLSMAIIFLALLLMVLAVMRQSLPMEPEFEPVAPAMIGPDARPTFDWYDYYAHGVGLKPIVTYTTRKLPNPVLSRVYLSSDHLVMAEAIWSRVKNRIVHTAGITTQFSDGTVVWTSAKGPSLPTVKPTWIIARKAPVGTDLAALLQLHMDHLREKAPAGIKPAPIPETEVLPIITRRSQMIFDYQVPAGLLRRDEKKMIWKPTLKMSLKILFNFIRSGGSGIS